MKESFEKLSLTNADGTKIDIPDYGTFELLLEHTRKMYPEIYEKHFGKNNIHARAFSNSESIFPDDDDYRTAYIDFVGGLKQALITPSGAEILSPVKTTLPVGFQQPKTLHELINGTLNIGKIYEAHEAMEEATYDAEQEYAAFEEIGQLAEKNPERFRSLYEDSNYSESITNIINKRNSDLLKQSNDDVSSSVGTEPCEEGDSSGSSDSVSSTG